MTRSTPSDRTSRRVYGPCNAAHRLGPIPASCRPVRLGGPPLRQYPIAMVEDDPGKANARRFSLLAEVGDGNDLVSQDTAALDHGAEELRPLPASHPRFGIGAEREATTRPAGRVKGEDLEDATGQRRQGSPSWSQRDVAALTRRHFLMLSSSLVVIAADGAGSAAAFLAGPELPFFGQYYGNALVSRGAANSQLNKSQEQGTWSFFYAERTGIVTDFLHHMRWGDGYSAGDGGQYTIEIREADPTTRAPLHGVAPICRITGIRPGNPNRGYKNVIRPFTSTGRLMAKQPYALIYRNTHSNPGSNYISANIGWHHVFYDASNPADYREPNGADPRSPGSSPTPVSGWTPVWIDGTLNWYPWPCRGHAGEGLSYRRLGPEYSALRYSDGQWTGLGGSYGGGSSYIATVRGTNHIRERFRVTRTDRKVSGVFVRIARYNTTTGNLIITLEEGPTSDGVGNGTTIEQISVPHATIYDVGSSDQANQVRGGPGSATDFVPFTWVPFSQSYMLEIGKIYNLRLSATGKLECRMCCSSRFDQQAPGVPLGSSLTWALWEARRQMPWNSWEDSRGMQVSADRGTIWRFFIGRLSPILFRCV